MNDHPSLVTTPAIEATGNDIDSGGQQRACVNVTDAAEILGISRGLAYQGVRDGSIPAVRVGKRWLVPRAALYALLGRQARRGSTRCRRAV